MSLVDEVTKEGANRIKYGDKAEGYGEAGRSYPKRNKGRL
jgi:hypothetical protein